MNQNGRIQLVIGIILGIFVIFLGRLFYIQVITDSYSLWAAQNAIRKVTIYPARGVIYDRNGERVVVNRPIYDLMLIPLQMTEKMDTASFCDLLEIDKTVFIERVEKPVSSLDSSPLYSKHKSAWRNLQPSRSGYTNFLVSMPNHERFVITQWVAQPTFWVTSEK